MRTLGIALAAGFLIQSGFIQTAVGQSILGSTATITGLVTDPLGAPIEGATVQAGSFKATTGKDGKYSLAGLPAGSYDVQVTASSLKAFQQKGLAVKTGEPLKLDAKL